MKLRREGQPWKGFGNSLPSSGHRALEETVVNVSGTMALSRLHISLMANRGRSFRL